MLRKAGILPANPLAALSDEKPLEAHAVGGVKALTNPDPSAGSRRYLTLAARRQNPIGRIKAFTISIPSA